MRRNSSIEVFISASEAQYPLLKGFEARFCCIKGWRAG